MDFNQLACYIKQLGCKLYLYDRAELKDSKCEATFQISDKGNPVIAMALKGFDNDTERLYTLLHEFAHYIQWLTGYWQVVHKESDGWDTIDKHLRYKRKRVSQEDLERARRTVLLLEYDAEMRTISLARFFSIPMDETAYLQNANSYMLQIKWATESKKWGDGIARFEEVEAGYLSVGDLLAQLTDKEKNIIALISSCSSQDTTNSKPPAPT